LRHQSRISIADAACASPAADSDPITVATASLEIAFFISRLSTITAGCRLGETAPQHYIKHQLEKQT
jgi:hypothetical protein